MKATNMPETGDNSALHLLPGWVAYAHADSADAAAFASGAALAILDVVFQSKGATLCAPLLRDRLALASAVACLKLDGRTENASDVRDAICLARTGEALGPSGEIFAVWRKLARLNLGSANWSDQVLSLVPDGIGEALLEQGRGEATPVAQAARVLSKLLQQFPHQEAYALMWADVTLARSVGWQRAIPMFATHLKRADIRVIATGAGDAKMLANGAVVKGCDATIRAASDLARRVANLNAVAPKLRAKGAAEAVAVFLSHDAVSPSGMLSPVIKGTSRAMTDRAARRLCDRLVDLGVVRELTGRATFRLYGL